MGTNNRDFETLYAAALLQFERRQAKLGKRGPLPCDAGGPVMLDHAVKARAQRRAKQKTIMSYFGPNEELTASQVAARMKRDTASVSSHLEAMRRQGLVVGERGDYGGRKVGNKRMDCWIYRVNHEKTI